MYTLLTQAYTQHLDVLYVSTCKLTTGENCENIIGYNQSNSYGALLVGTEAIVRSRMAGIRIDKEVAKTMK